ncbi:sensor histidine kinase [Thalassobacillus sp. CUG 92003]|uniref:sensor histidine kinase n=1 Tax=Thalassobacillus sp. CUG 92003 TaxID=2736641 RepID=UPI0015E79C6F|nr:ATP-binding protein [Thalassobacillus sp. CUG 92003]
MKSLKSRHIAVLLFFVASIVYLMVLSVTSPYMGVELRYESGDYFIEERKSNGWADSHGVPLGSELVRVNGQDPDTHMSVNAFHELERVSSFTVQEGHDTFIYQDIRGLSLQHWLLYIVVPGLFFLGILAIAALLYKKVPSRYSSEQLIIFFLTIALGYMSNTGAIRNDLYGTFLNTSMFLVAPVLLTHYLYKYFAELNVYWFSKRMYQLFYGIAVGMSLLELYFLLKPGYPGWFRAVPALTLLGLISALFLIIIRGYKQHKYSSSGPIFKYVNVGMGIAFIPYVLFYLLPSLIFGFYIMPLEVVACFLIALPVTFLYLVTREQLIDITFVMGRIRYNTLISAIPSVVMTAITAMVLNTGLTVLTLFQIYLAVHLLLIIFLSLKETLDFRLQRYLFAAKYSYQESMHRLSQDMKQQSNAVDLMKTMRNEVKNVLDVREIYIYSKHNQRNIYCVYDRIPTQILDHFTHDLEMSKPEIGSVIETTEGFGVVVGYSLSKVTMMWCSGKKDFTTLNRDEKLYLQTIAHNANIAIENMNLIEDLLKELQTLKNDHTQRYPAWLSRLLFSIAENQRKQLSIDLHDTVLQEQLYLYRRMDDMLENRSDLPDSLHEELIRFRESLLDGIHLIRETCNELRPAFIEELGLVQSLKNLIQQYQLRSNFTVYFHHHEFDVQLDQEHVLATYRIVQELLSNAMKHSKANTVTLLLSNDNQMTRLYYADNGIGMDYSESRDLFSHIGLSGIEQRVNGLHGSIDIRTAHQKGFTAEIIFPHVIYREVSP